MTFFDDGLPTAKPRAFAPGVAGYYSAGDSYPNWSDKTKERVEGVCADFILASPDTQGALMRVLYDLLMEGTP